MELIQALGSSGIIGQAAENLYAAEAKSHDDDEWFPLSDECQSALDGSQKVLTGSDRVRSLLRQIWSVLTPWNVDSRRNSRRHWYMIHVSRTQYGFLFTGICDIISYIYRYIGRAEATPLLLTCMHTFKAHSIQRSGDSSQSLASLASCSNFYSPKVFKERELEGRRI